MVPLERQTWVPFTVRLFVMLRFVPEALVKFKVARVEDAAFRFPVRLKMCRRRS